jgi:hypothetical protein
MKEELNQYKAEPPRFWKALPMLGGDGYDDMEAAEKHGWHAIDAWGRDGYTLGSLPLIIIFYSDHQGRFDVIEYVEGDVEMWSCPSPEIRQQVTDELAFFHWKHSNKEWVRDYTSVDELPDELKGPYRQ